MQQPPFKVLHSSSGRSPIWLYIAFSFFTLFNILDLSSTILALRLGFAEGNSALIFAASTLGISLVDILVVLKSVFIIGMATVVFLGVAPKYRSLNNKIGKNTIFLVIVGFAILFGLVCANNFTYILSAI